MFNDLDGDGGQVFNSLINFKNIPSCPPYKKRSIFN